MYTENYHIYLIQYTTVSIYIYICLSYSEHTYIITDTCKTTDRLWQQPQKKKYWHKCRPVDQ